MSRLIDADALESVFEKERAMLIEQERFGAEHILVHHAMRLIDDAPTVDAAPVVHGRWVNDDRFWGATCSVCGSHPWKGFIPSAEMLIESEKYNYCPTCGAKMDGGEDDGADA